MIHCNAILKESLGRRRYAASTRETVKVFNIPIHVIYSIRLLAREMMFFTTT